MQSQLCKQAPVLHWKHWQGTAVPKSREENRSYLSRDSVTVLSNTIWENLVKDLLLHRYPSTLFEYTPSFWCRATEDEHLQVNGRCSRQLEHAAGRVIPIRKRKAVKRKALWYMETLRMGFLDCYNSCSLRIWSQVWCSGACWSQKVKGNGITPSSS